jgi:fluoroacetyl-CoA thioesterase
VTTPTYPQLPLGLTATFDKEVPIDWTLVAYDPSLPGVLSTPHLISMMEIAAGQAIKPHLPEGYLTVGTRIEIDHLKAVTAGKHVSATATLVAQHGRFLTFDVEARSGHTIIGRGQVKRAFILPSPFLSKAESR